MIGRRACCAAGVSALIALGPAFAAQQVVRTPPRPAHPVLPPTVEETKTEVLRLIPALADVPDACPPSFLGNPMAVEVEGIELVRRMKAYPDLAPTVSDTLVRWRTNLNQRAAYCSGRKMKKGSADGGDPKRITARRHAQIGKASSAFARYRVALGY